MVRIVYTELIVKAVDWVACHLVSRREMDSLPMTRDHCWCREEGWINLGVFFLLQFDESLEGSCFRKGKPPLKVLDEICGVGQEIHEPVPCCPVQTQDSL